MAALVTFTVTVHEPLAGIVPPESARDVPLFAAVTVPPHVVAPLAEAVLTRPAGYVSVNAAPVTATALPLVSVTVSTEVVPTETAAGVNDLAIAGCASTVSVAEAPADGQAVVEGTFPVEFG